MSATENDEAKPTIKEDNEACVHAMLVCSSMVFPMVLNAAIELDLFDIIAKAGPGAYISPCEIASHLSTQNQDTPMMLDGMLFLLASHSLLTCSLHTLEEDGEVERLYGLAPAGKFFVKNVDGGSLGFLFLLNCQRDIMETWYHLKDAILDGGNTYARAYGMSMYQYMYTHPIASKYFNRAMADQTNIIMNKILHTYKGFEGLKSLVDVGGGIGTSINMIISKFPSIKGINFDLPAVIKNAPSYPGIEHVEGDMFISIPEGEAFLLKWICHNWDDEHCVKLLRNCHEALPTTGKVVIMDYIMPMVPDNSIAAKEISQMHNLMSAYLGGKERTRKEFEALSKAAGFLQIQFVSCAYTTWVMELYK